MNTTIQYDTELNKSVLRLLIPIQGTSWSMTNYLTGSLYIGDQISIDVLVKNSERAADLGIQLYENDAAIYG